MMKMLSILILATVISSGSAVIPEEEKNKMATAVSLCGDENNDGYVNGEEMALFFSKNYDDFIRNNLITKAGGIPDFVFKHLLSHDRNLDMKVTREEIKAYALVHTKSMDNCHDIQQSTKMLTKHPFTTEEAQELSNCIDVNKNGKITIEEFTDFFGVPELTNEIKDVNGLNDFKLELW